MTESGLIEKLRAIEALFAGATTSGERTAAAEARQRIQRRLAALQVEDKPVEYRFKLGDEWSRQLLVALLRRYDLRPYRYARQRRTTVMVRVPRRFVAETLWPAFQRIDGVLHQYLHEVTARVIAESVHRDSSEAEEVQEPAQLGTPAQVDAGPGHPEDAG